MKVYLSGPMRGIERYNYPAFQAAAEDLREQGHDVVNPAESFGGDQTRAWTDYMRVDLASILDGVEALVVLPGWQGSVGARIEVLAALSCGLPILRYEPDWPLEIYDEYDIDPGDLLADVDVEGETDESPLDEARRLVEGARQQDYGHPWDDFSRTALMWSGLFGVDVEPEQVALAMICVKISRQCNAPKRDNIVDGIGYWQTLHMVQERRRKLVSDVADALAEHEQDMSARYAPEASPTLTVVDAANE